MIIIIIIITIITSTIIIMIIRYLGLPTLMRQLLPTCQGGKKEKERKKERKKEREGIENGKRRRVEGIFIYIPGPTS